MDPQHTDTCLTGILSFPSVLPNPPSPDCWGHFSNQYLYLYPGFRVAVGPPNLRHSVSHFESCKACSHALSLFAVQNVNSGL